MTTAETYDGMQRSPDEYTILLVDDDVVDRDLCKRFLSKEIHVSYKFLEASDGVTARQQLKLHNPDCILIDRYLEQEDGCILMAELHEQHPYTPMIILTGDGSGSAALSALRHGASDYLTKSDLSTQSLHRCIKNAIEKTRLSIDLDRQRRELNYSYGLLVQQHEVLSHYYHTVTHELKNPLASCKEFLNILKDDIAGPINPQQQELLTIANRNCERMTEFLDDLFESSGIDTDKIQLNIKPCPLEPLILDAVGDYLDADAIKNMPINVVNETDNDVAVMVDRPRIRRALTKMLVAAQNNILGEEPIRILITDKRQELLSTVTISYTGIKNTENSLYHFSTQKQLKQLQDTETDYNVLGLDILFCKRVIELHNGLFNFERKQNLGGIFTTKLPSTNGI